MATGHFGQFSAVREKERDIIGQPKATVVHRKHKGKGGSKRLKLTPQAGASECLDIYKPEEAEHTAVPRPILSPLLRGTKAHVPVTMRRPREQRVAPVTFHYTHEAIQRANFLFQTKGAVAMNTYLKEQRNMTSHAEMAETLTTDKEAKRKPEVAVPGGLQKEADNARIQAQHWRAEAVACAAKADHWERVAAAVDQALTLVNQDVVIDGKPKREKRETGFWPRAIRNVAQKLAPGEILKKEIWQQKLQAEVPDATPANIYAAINQAIKNGSLGNTGDRACYRFNEKHEGNE